MNCLKRRLVPILALFFLISASRGKDAPKDEQAEAVYFDETKVVTLFSFDDVSIPFTQNLKLRMRRPEKHPANPVVRIGKAGTIDSWAVQFYGSVIREPDGGKFRMWYCASSREERKDRSIPRSALWRVAYAESDDGVRWVKPNLGLVQSQGSKANNLVKLDPPMGVLNLKVLHEPDDPNPEHRYKMGAHVWFPKHKVRLGSIAPYVSADGLTWKLLADIKPVNGEMPADETLIPPLHMEPMGGLYKWDGLYHVIGQNANGAPRPFHGRVTRLFVSPDFRNWSQSSAIGFVRTSQHTLLGNGRSLEGEQTHEGVSVWNRGNVLIGTSGLWHGAKEWPDISVDLGFNISNDGLRFREPYHDRVFIKRGKDGEWDQGGVLQGQGFENIGEHTFIYYGACDYSRAASSPPRGGLGIAMLPRDRFADLSVAHKMRGDGVYQMPDTVSEFMTTSVKLENGVHRFYLNARGVSEEASLKVELLDHNTIPIPEFSGDHASIVTRSGFQVPIDWGDRHEVADLPGRVRIKVTFQGKRYTEIRFSALYIR